MTEGENVGPVTADGSILGKFYYNSNIKKMVVVWDVAGAGYYEWTTFNPTVNVGLSLGHPTASQFLTTSTNWGTTNLTNAQFTVSGSNNTVVLATTKINDAGGVPKMIQCTKNSGLINGFYSVCEYGNYVHEVTIGSEYNDDDFIGIVIAAKKGLGTNPNATDMLTLVFNGNSGSVNVVYNSGQDVYSFNDYAGSTSAGVMIGGTSPFGTGYYNTKGQVRVKIIKTSTIVSIYTTQRMGLNGIVQAGNPNPYTLLYQFDLTDKTTWNGAPSYAVGNELLKFTSGTSFGYLTSSQPLSQFYDMFYTLKL